MDKKYFVRKSWNRPEWWTICYNNSVATPTLLCETPSKPTADHVAEILNEADKLATASPISGLLPSQFWGGEILSAMNEATLKEFYELLKRHNQRLAALYLEQYALKIAEIDLEAK